MSTSSAEKIDVFTSMMFSRMLERKPDSVKFLNKQIISKYVLPEGFIESHPDAVDWSIASATQPLSMHLINKFSHLVDYRALATNKHLPLESIVGCIDKMDFAKSQEHNRYSTELMREWFETLDHSLLIKFQKLDTGLLQKILEDSIKEERWIVVKGKMDDILRYQKVSESFMNDMLNLESQTNAENPLVLVDRKLAVKHQKLSYDWLWKNIMDNNSLIQLVFTYQEVDDNFINTFIDKTKDNIDTVSLMNQKMNEYTITTVLNAAKYDESLFRNTLKVMTQKQRFDLSFFESIDMTFTVSIESTDNIAESITVNVVTKNLRDDTKFMKELYNTLFMRTLDPTNDNWISWGLSTVRERVVPYIRWYNIASTDLTSPQIDSLLDMNLEFPWYTLLRNNTLNESQIEKAINNNIFGAVDVWMAVTALDDEKDCSAEFVANMTQYKKWWEYIPADNITDFVHNCVESVEIGSEYNHTLDDTYLEKKNALKLFLDDFVNNTEWTKLLRDETLPEWFIWVFSKFADKITARMNGVDYWWKISRYQKLSPALITKYIGELDLVTVLIYQKVPAEFIKSHTQFFTPECWDAINKYQDQSMQ